MKHPTAPGKVSIQNIQTFLSSLSSKIRGDFKFNFFLKALFFPHVS